MSLSHSPREDSSHPLAAENAADPHPAYAQYREAGPVHKVTIRPGLDAWLVTRYREARAVLCDDRMRLNPEATTERIRAAIAAGRPEERASLFPNLLSTDPPEHTVLRKVVAQWLSPARVEGLRNTITAETDLLAERIVRQGKADLVADYAVPMTVGVICELLGIPEQDREPFRSCGVAIAREELSGEGAYDRMSDQLADSLVPVIVARFREPGDDLLSALTAAHTAGQVSRDLLFGTAFQLFFGGHVSTAALITNGFVVLLDNPGQLALLRENPALISSAVEEFLRYDGPLKVPTWRFPIADVEIGGQLIRAGEPVLVLVGCAARDPEHFADPDSLDITRSRSAHLTFGAGPHYCLGWAVAKMEAEIAVMTLLGRADRVRLAVPVAELPWRDNLQIRGPRELPVLLEPSA